MLQFHQNYMSVVYEALEEDRKVPVTQSGEALSTKPQKSRHVSGNNETQAECWKWLHNGSDSRNLKG